MRGIAFLLVTSVVLSTSIGWARKQGVGPTSNTATDEPTAPPNLPPDEEDSPPAGAAVQPVEPALPAPAPPAPAPPAPPPARAQAPAAAAPPTLPIAEFPYATKWSDNVYSGTGIWPSIDAGAGAAILDGDPAIVGTARGTGLGARVRGLIHLGHTVAVGVRLGYESAAFSPPADQDWATHDVAQTSLSGTLRVSPIVLETFELSATGHAGVSQSRFRATRRDVADERDWAGTSSVLGGGVEASMFQSAARGRFELLLFGEAEYRPGDEKRAKPAYEAGGLPKSARATLLFGAGLGVHF